MAVTYRPRRGTRADPKFCLQAVLDFLRGAPLPNTHQLIERRRLDQRSRLVLQLRLMGLSLEDTGVRLASFGNPPGRAPSAIGLSRERTTQVQNRALDGVAECYAVDRGMTRWIFARLVASRVARYQGRKVPRVRLPGFLAGDGVAATGPASRRSVD